jgi:hypothetical protein
MEYANDFSIYFLIPRIITYQSPRQFPSIYFKVIIYFDPLIRPNQFGLLTIPLNNAQLYDGKMVNKATECNKEDPCAEWSMCCSLLRMGRSSQ